jgi:hypothetical protein
MVLKQDELPTDWKPPRFPEDMRASIPLSFPDDAWWRVLEDFGRGYPAFHIEFAWGEDRTVRFATVAGFTFADEPDGVEESEVLDRRTIPLDQIASITHDLGGNGGSITLAKGETYIDRPALLIQKLLNEDDAAH